MPTEISGSTGVNKIQDGTVVNADINSSAAIAGSKISGGVGKVLQVVSGTSTGSTATSSQSYVASNLAATITPTSTSVSSSANSINNISIPYKKLLIITSLLIFY